MHLSREQQIKLEWVYEKGSLISLWPELIQSPPTLCLLHALRWVSSLGTTHVLFEMDNKTVVESINKQQANCSEFGHILSGCQSILDTTQNFQVKFTQANVVIYCLAGASICNVSPQFFNSSPTFTVPHLINELHEVCFAKRKKETRRTKYLIKI